MKLQMTDLKAQYESIKPEIDAAMAEVMTETNFILGKPVSLLEAEVAAYHGAGYGVGVASGTDALVLALAALGIGKGDEVITTPFTFIATVEAISRVGATPVFCDIEPDTYNISCAQIEKKINRRTKAIVPVHLYGLPCDMDGIQTIAAKHGLKIIEDCAQSFGSEIRGKKVGTLGDMGCLSFFPAKTLGCYGDGGMVITGSDENVKKLKMLRNHGSAVKYYYSAHGFNSRLDTLQAAVLRVKLKHIDSWIAKRRENARLYAQYLGEMPGVVLPVEPEGRTHTFNYYTIRVRSDRDSLEKKLKDKGVPTMIYYPLCLHLQDVYKELGHKMGDFPVAEQAQREVLSLPMYPELPSEHIKSIASAVKEVVLTLS